MEPQPPKREPPRHIACARCRERKVKCDGGKPGCARCVMSRSCCQYVVRGVKRGRKMGNNGNNTMEWKRHLRTINFQLADKTSTTRTTTSPSRPDSEQQSLFFGNCSSTTVGNSEYMPIHGQDVVSSTAATFHNNSNTEVTMSPCIDHQYSGTQHATPPPSVSVPSSPSPTITTSTDQDMMSQPPSSSIIPLYPIPPEPPFPFPVADDDFFAMYPFFPQMPVDSLVDEKYVWRYCAPVLI